jgi:hypothetical protein
MAGEWMAQLSDDLKANELLAKFEKLPDLGREYVNLYSEIEKLGGLEKIRASRIPGENDSPEAREAFLRAMGVPEKEDEYDINPFDAETEVKLDDVYLSLRKAAKGANLSKEQAKKMSEWHIGALKQYLDRANETVQNRVKETDETLKKEWGPEYDETKEKISRLLSDLPADKMELVKEKGYANDPVFISILGHVARKTGEHVFITGGHGGPDAPKGLTYKNMDKYKST